MTTSFSVRHLVVADLRQSKCHHSALAQPVSTRKARLHLDEAGLHLHAWLKRHHHLRAVAIEQGEPTVALMLLWEADLSKLFPCRAASFVRRLGVFSEKFVSQLRITQLSPGVATSKYMKAKDAAVSGENLLDPWKAQLVTPDTPTMRQNVPGVTMTQTCRSLQSM